MKTIIIKQKHSFPVSQTQKRTLHKLIFSQGQLSLNAMLGPELPDTQKFPNSIMQVSVIDGKMN